MITEARTDLDFYAYQDDETFAAMSIPERNEILDELRRREQTIEARAEERRNGGFFVPSWWARRFA